MHKWEWEDIYKPTAIVLGLVLLLALTVAVPALGFLGWACLAIFGITTAIRLKRRKKSN